jgi:alkanesulfonate monooxygenase SsuD/methylene tetrahydromethanopterin reductase-like flavin-dependent oxidoreductase (luciferase family)
MAMSRNEQGAREAVKPYIAMIIGALARQQQLPIFAQAGITPEAAERFAERLMRGEVASDMVSDSMIEVLAIAGSPERCRESLAQVVEAGVTSPTIFFPPQMDYETSARDIVTHLFPHFL